jgi:hypothetical protein
MPRILGRLSGRNLGELDEHEYGQLMAVFEALPRGKTSSSSGPDVVERLTGSGASERLLAVVQQILRDGEDFEVEWEPDAD